MLLVKNCNFFLYLFSVKIRLEIMFNNVLDRKEIFFGYKNFNLFQFQKLHFSKGANACFWSKNVFFFAWVVFGKNIMSKIMFNDSLDTKETLLSRKKIQSFKVPKIAFSQRGWPMLLVKKCRPKTKKDQF